ncbi:MAG TPA: hypothetical protein VM074_01590 [Solimonas sp.]|nr:hypothetical protein [Solimonas sp.]
MDLRSLMLGVMAALVLLGAMFIVALRQGTAVAPVYRAIGQAVGASAFPPTPRVHPEPPLPAAPASPHVLTLDREIARIGDQGARSPEPLAERYARASSLRTFAFEMLGRAVAGDGAAQYHLYLALEQCVMYLRLGREDAQAMYAQQMVVLADARAEERSRWEFEYNRCQDFAAGGVEPFAAALGDRRPGAANEYASVWFELSADSGYPLAQAERALRSDAYSPMQRREWLEQAAAGGDPAVYWALFSYALAQEPQELATAWLIVACRAGMDCTEASPWYRTACDDQDEDLCQLGESALEHYWFRLPSDRRAAAWARAADVERLLAQGEWGQLPWPVLQGRDADWRPDGW